MRNSHARAQAEDADSRHQGPQELVLQVAVGVQVGRRLPGGEYAEAQQDLLKAAERERAGELAPSSMRREDQTSFF